MRRLPFAFALFAVGLFVAGGVVWKADDPSTAARPLSVEPTTFDLDLSPGKHELVVRVTNPASVPKRIVGFGDGCGENCCYRAKRRGVIVIGPGETCEYLVSLTVKWPGPFASGFDLYLDDNGLRAVELSVRGTGVGVNHAED